MNKKWIRKFLIWFLLMGSISFASHADNSVQIKSCRIISSGTVVIQASCEDTDMIKGSSCYLFSMLPIKNQIASGMKPVSHVRKSKEMKFYAKLNQTTGSSNLYRKFVIAERTPAGFYQIISNMRIISNPQKIARYTYKFPTVSSKKGLQVCEGMLEDAVELRVQHSTININFSELFAESWQQNSSSSISYKYHGQTYWFQKGVVAGYDRQLIALKETNCIVSAILLLSWRSDLLNLIYPAGRVPGHAFYAWNIQERSGREKLQAAISFLAERYSASNGKHGRIVNWIVGNEVNNYKVYNYAGEQSITKYANIYAQAFLLTYQTVTSVYSNARVYISLDHLWNTHYVPGTFASRRMLDNFAKQLTKYGAVRWNLAYHPYSCPLTEPRFWANVNGQITEAITTPVINMGNIYLLSGYIKQKYGTDCRIILSEQGYTSVQNGQNVSRQQAAAIAYSYLLTESDDQIDSFIMNRHVDHDEEVRQGLNLGLWTTSSRTQPEYANTKKYAWTVFKYMDSNQSEKYTSFAFDQIGISNWEEVIANYNPSLYTKYQIENGKIRIQSYSGKTVLAQKWLRYGASSGITKTKNTFRVIHNGKRNRHCLWGFSQRLSKKTDFSETPSFCTTLKIGGSTYSKVQVLLRMYSGSNVFECRKNIPAGRDVKLTANLSQWKYRDKVNRIQLLVCPAVSGAGWKNGSYMEMKNTGMQ